MEHASVSGAKKDLVSVREFQAATSEACRPPGEDMGVALLAFPVTLLPRALLRIVESQIPSNLTLRAGRGRGFEGSGSLALHLRIAVHISAPRIQCAAREAARLPREDENPTGALPIARPGKRIISGIREQVMMTPS